MKGYRGEKRRRKPALRHAAKDFPPILQKPCRLLYRRTDGLKNAALTLLQSGILYATLNMCANASYCREQNGDIYLITKTPKANWLTEPTLRESHDVVAMFRSVGYDCQLELCRSRRKLRACLLCFPRARKLWP